MRVGLLTPPCYPIVSSSPSSGASGVSIPHPACITPLVYSHWLTELQGFPDPAVPATVLARICEGFRLGFKGNHCKSLSANMRSASENPLVVDQYLLTEHSLGRVTGPFVSPLFPNLHVSWFGVIPKSQPGKWRLILDLSHPPGLGVNDGIDPEEYAVKYIKVDDAIHHIMKLGRGTLLAKTEVKSAYRLLPVHQDDRPLLGMKWWDKFFVDLALWFGLRSTPRIFSDVADALQWIVQHPHQVSDLLHYLDDFLTLGPPDSPICQVNLNTLLAVSAPLGVPMSPANTVGPTTCLTFLGIELDSVLLECRLPEEKLNKAQLMVSSWSARKSCTKRELLSLIGVLHHVCKVVVPGRTFLRRMINLSKSVISLSRSVRLNIGFRRDLHWWSLFLASWNGRSFFRWPEWSPPSDFQLSSDASGSFGYGAFFNGRWFYGPWAPAQVSRHITYKELYPILLASVVWGPLWSTRWVLFQCDDEMVVSIINSGTSCDDDVMHLLRCLVYVAMQFNFVIWAVHIFGVQNVLADALSRFKLQVFHQLAPLANPEPDAIPWDAFEKLDELAL